MLNKTGTIDFSHKFKSDCEHCKSLTYLEALATFKKVIWDMNKTYEDIYNQTTATFEFGDWNGTAVIPNGIRQKNTNIYRLPTPRV